MKATSRIPIVFFYVGDPVASGLVQSLARPGGNVTGFGGLGVGLHARQLALLKQTVPKARRVAVLMNPDFSFHQAVWPEVQETAAGLGLAVQRIELRGPQDFEAALAAASPRSAARPDIVHMLGQPFLGGQGRRLVEWATEQRMPAICPFVSLVRQGFLMAYTNSLDDDIRQVPGLIVRILRDGVKPADLPVQQPTKFDFVVNLKAARAIGLSVPQAVLLQATEVIE